jgi:hypothetical protein
MTQCLAYVPKLYRDELFYSMAARYHRHVGNVAFRDTSGELFGDRFMRPTFDLPSHLPAFLDRVPPERHLSVERLALEHTHLPYYTAYLPAERREEALRRMVAGGRSLHVSLGLNGFLVPAVSALRFCPSCLAEMTAEEGEWWWRRAHQLPGVLVCPDHGCSLRVSTVSLLSRDHHAFAAASPSTCRPDAPALLPNVSGESVERLRRVSEESARLLVSPGHFKTSDERKEFYRACLGQAGFLKSTQIDVETLLGAFSSYWEEILGLLPGVGAGSDPASLEWLLLLCRKQQKSTHPLLHVLFRVFIDSCGATGSGMLRLQPKPFGEGPWRCRNPVASHCGDLTIPRVSESRTNVGMLTGLFECSCGYAYTMSVSDKGTLHGPRYRRFGPLLEPALRRLVAEGASLSRAARELGLNRKTLAAEAARFELPVAWKSAAPAAKPPRKAAPPRRRASKPRRRVGSRQRVRGASIDWAARDAEWAALVPAIAEEILQATPLVRVYLRSIEARLERPGCIYVRKPKVPLTLAAVAAHGESLEEFRRRRIHWVIDELREQGRRLTVSAVTHRAATGPEWHDYVEEQLSSSLGCPAAA